MAKLKLYFDSCLYGRHCDNQKDARVAAETIAIVTIIKAAQKDGDLILGSMAVADELGRIKDDERRTDVLGFYNSSKNEFAEKGDDVRVQAFHAAGLGVTDSLHLATAETAGADYLLTVDDDFERIATTKNLSKVKVMNPLTYIAGGPI